MRLPTGVLKEHCTFWHIMPAISDAREFMLHVPTSALKEHCLLWHTLPTIRDSKVFIPCEQVCADAIII